MIRHACRAGGWPCGQVRESAAWSGSNTSHCSGCGETFIGRAFDRHQTRGSDGRVVCVPPTACEDRSGRPALEKVDRPAWAPGYAWRLAGAADRTARFHSPVEDETAA